MSRGHNAHKGFSQTSKQFDDELKEQHQRSRSSQHSTQTAKESMDKIAKAPQKAAPLQTRSSKR